MRGPRDCTYSRSSFTPIMVCRLVNTVCEAAASVYSFLYPPKLSPSPLLTQIRIPIQLDNSRSEEEFVTTTLLEQKSRTLIASEAKEKLPRIVSFPLPPLPTPSTTTVDYLFFFVPGNPGTALMYESFISYMNDFMSQYSVVFVVPSLAGHSIISPASPITVVKNSSLDVKPAHSDRLYSLNDQIAIMRGILQHQMKKYPNARVILGGHSIGAFIASYLVDSIPSHNLVHVMFVCPALMEILATPNARRLKPLFTRFGRNIMAFLFYLFEKVPIFIRSLMIVIYIRLGMGAPSLQELKRDATCIIQGSLDINPSIVRQVLYMSETEMECVKAFNIQIVRAYAAHLSIFFAVVDNWCPPDYVRAIAQSVPEATVTILPPIVPHAFVLGSCKVVALSFWRRLAPLLVCPR